MLEPWYIWTYRTTSISNVEIERLAPEMWAWFTRYPFVRIEDLGTPYEEDLTTEGSEEVVEYDYIIVGGLSQGSVWILMGSGGTAGCVLANRLSANPSVKVLLIERGSLNDTLIASNVILSHPPFGLLPVRAIKMVPQEALSNRLDTAYESLSLGGRTRINAGLYLPGCPAEYESWGEGWQWDDVAPFFLKSEGRLELERVKTADSSQATYNEGGEWKTRIVKAEFGSSQQYVFL